MLTSKLSQLKRELESKIYLDEDDKKTLRILKVFDTDQTLQKLISSGEILTKSFAVAPEYCPSCGKKN